MTRWAEEWRLFEGGDYFKYIPSKGGDFSSESINRRRAIIRGNTVISIC